MKKFLFLLLLLTGCDVNVKIDSNVAAPVKKNVAEVSDADLTATGKKIDPKDISPTNAGRLIDMNEDGYLDFAIFENGNTLYFEKGKADGTREPKQAILTTKKIYRVYAIAPTPLSTRPALLLWDDNLNEYYSLNKGEKGGMPFFNSIEDAK